MSQTRKQRIMGDVKRKRRQRAAITVTIVAVLIAIIVVAVATYHVTPDLVPLPDYLSHCVAGSLLYHSHPNLTITISGVNFPLPPAPGTFNNGCAQPIHTHDATGVIHIETDTTRDYTLGDWFLLWGHWEQNPTRAIFNSTQIFDHKVVPGHTLTMTINSASNPSFDKHIFPHNAAPTSNLCTVPATGCVQDDIVITYS